MVSADAPLIVSHYRVTGVIGAGGMGEVYAGIDETLRRRVALKAIRPDRRLDPDAKARFLREARILSQLDHAHICRVYDYIETPERDWLVLELIEGETLTTAIQGGVRPADRLRIAGQIAAVLVATHAAGVVHRDLKPGNVMLTRSGDVKVLDFGLSATVLEGAGAEGPAASVAPLSPANAAMVDVTETHLPTDSRVPSASELSLFQSQVGGVKGTVGYMSPEQARGELATSASDMYSFGLVLQELFTGRVPYDETSDYFAALGKAQRGETREPVGVSSDVAALLRRLKSVVPAERPTAVDTSQQLRWIGEAPRRRLRNLAAAGVLLALALGALKYTIDLSRERTAAVLARQEADQRRDQAEDLIGFMLGDLRSKLTAVGRLEILDDIGKKAVDYFAAVPTQALTNGELHRRSQAMHQLGQVRQARADFDGARKAYDESLAQAEDLTRRDPDNATWQLALGTSHFYVGDLKRRSGDLDGALANFQAYQAIGQRLVDKDSTNAEWKLELSYGHSNIAGIHSARGDWRAAKEQLEITSALQDQLVAAKPDDAALLASRANSHNRLAVVLERLGDLPGAVEKFENELRIYAALAAKDPRNARAKRRVEVSRTYLGLTLRALGRDADALAHLQQALADARELVALDPTNADWQRDRAVTEMWVGRLLLDRGDAGGAMRLFEAALPVLNARGTPPQSSATARLDLGRAREGLAAGLHAARRYDEAMRHADAAVGILTPLVSNAAIRADVTLAVAMTENLRGRIATSQGNGAAARAAWMRSADLLRPLAERGGDRSPLDPLVRALVYLGRVDEARPWAEKLTALGYRDRTFVELWKTRGSSTLSKTPATE